MIVALLLASALAFPAVERTRLLMGTLCSISAEGPEAARAVEEAFAEIARLDLVMSSWRDDSELARWNAAAGAPAPCSPELFAVLDSAAAIAALTDGAFDPTIEPLMKAWDLRGEGRVPVPGERERARARVGWRSLRIDRASGAATLLEAGMAVDLGGIGKGYALDRAGAVLAQSGVTRALLNFGGEILALGRWPARIASPVERLQPAIALELEGRAASTSAQSERGFEAAGRRHGHVVDPATGVPVPGRASVTVVAASATRADGLSTALLVMGRERAERWCARHPEVGVLWLEPSEDGRLRAWRWNLAARAVGGAEVDWMNPRRVSSALSRP